LNDKLLTMLDNVSQPEFGSVIDVLDVGIIVLDGQDGIVGWNEWLARITGHAKQSVLGKNLYEIFPGLLKTRLPAAISDALEVGSSSVLTHSLNKLLPLCGEDGHELLHNIIVRPVSSGRSRSCLLQINDVTVAVTRERVLRERQNARYHAIVDSAPDAIITTNLDCTIQWVNGASQHVFGYAAPELLGQKIDLLLVPDGETARAFGEDATRRSDGADPLLVVGRRKDGRLANFEVSFGRWEADNHLFVTSIWRDVTERMLAEAAIRESESRHRTLSEALPQLVWTCDAKGECDYFNPQWQNYTGTPVADHLGWGWINAVHDAERDDFKAAWETSVESGRVFDVDARLRGAGGTHRWFKFRSIPVRAADGTITRWFGTATDITDHAEARETLRRSNEELEVLVAARTREREVALSLLHESQKMETIGQLTGGVAHDFNNLLAVILGSLALLKKSLPDDPRTSRLLEGAIQGAERGATLTKRLLAFARRQELKLESVEIPKLVQDMLDFLRQSVGPSIAIIVDIPPEVHAVRIDANQLELALMNLAVNARDAMPKGGTLTITCRDETNGRDILPMTLPRGEYVRVSVADSGSGMSADTLAKAMEPFFTTKGIGKGTGLGLSMVHGLTAQCGGAMHISSQLGKGTVVTLWLPRASADDVVKAPEQPMAHTQDAVRRKLSILLVDDDALVSMNTANMLMDLGHNVVESHSATHALQFLASDAKFDVVVTDYAMPGMNGLDLATKIRQMKPEMPVILATGYAELPSHSTLDFPRLAKPYSQGELADLLETTMRKHFVGPTSRSSKGS
jgi:PAS domain S-box-containing protein